jgi:small GTP-binding protein
MSMIINNLAKQIQFKLVYYGPAMSGKTTTLKSLFRHFGKEDQIKSIESTVNRTLFFDYGTILFQNKNWEVKLNIYTTTGQDFYCVTRPTIIQATDGIIFIVDSQKIARERNIISWNELNNFFHKQTIQSIPKIIAFNKQDKLNKFEIKPFLEEIRCKDYKNIRVKKTIAINGEGVLECFEEIIGMVIENSHQKEFLVEKS